MNIQQQQPNQSKPPSWEAISKHFSLPLSDAANNLGTSLPSSHIWTFKFQIIYFLLIFCVIIRAGVCVSVLKKICRENGLDRWPYRKVSFCFCFCFSRFLSVIFFYGNLITPPRLFQYLAGKSIEDIRRYAAREKIKAIADLAKAANKRCVFSFFFFFFVTNQCKQVTEF